MNSKVKPSEVLSKTIENLLNGYQPTEELLADLLRLGAERILQETTEVEVDEFLGCGWYQRSEQGQSHRGYRNGYTPVSFKITQGLAKAFIEDYAANYPSMVKCFNDDLQAFLVHLKYPHGHRKSIRTNNLIERSFVEQKRRTKIIPAHVNEKGAMKMVYGTLIWAARRWQRVRMDPADLILLKTLRQTMCSGQPITLTDNRISFKLAA